VVAYRGRDGRPLRLRKLRTMTATEPHRVTGLGRLLRAAYLDELPALLALARGDTTLVGPRAQPATTAEAPLTIRPGLLRGPGAW
jgi:lipopolysaccharide/colanic/teichoic acid biosynthesis glycosyltransferase